MNYTKNNVKQASADKVIPKRVAAIDIGSNAMRMQVFERNGSGKIHIVATLRKPVRLGRDVFHNGRILDESFSLALESMKEFLRVIEEYAVSQVAAVATSAVREASNGPSFVEQVLKETGIEIQIIGGSEEARLIITAILDRMRLEGLTALHVEAGGGSVEVSYIEDARIQFSMTHELGAVRLMEVLNAYSDSAEFRDIVRKYINITHKRLRHNVGKKKVDRFIATGGNIDSVLWLVGQTGWGEIKMDNGIPRLAMSTLVEVVKRLSMYSFRDRIDKLHIRPDRADVILPASLVYASFAEMAKADWIYAPGVGVRDGLAIELFRREEPPHKREKHKQLISAVKAVGEKYEYDALHAEIVASYAIEIFDAAKEIHGLSDSDRILLEVAALLHDIGYFVNISRHHKHSYYLIYESEIAGLAPHDLLLIANVARYHRKATPRDQHENFRILSQKDREIVLKLSSILRVADALDREHAGLRMPLAIKPAKTTLEIGLPPSRDRGLIGWAMAAKGGLFTEVFGLNIVLN